MIIINAVLDKNDIIKHCGIKGHSGFGTKGTDIVCAAVSLLADTFLQVVSKQEGVVLTHSAPHRGELEFSISYSDNNTGTGLSALKNNLKITSDFFITGVKSVSFDFPKNCQVKFIYD